MNDQLTEKEYRAKYPNRLRLYDVSLDEFRDAVQRDIDLLMSAAFNWGSIREGINALHETSLEMHEKYLRKVKQFEPDMSE